MFYGHIVNKYTYIYSPSTVYRDQVADEPEKFGLGKVH